MPELTPLVLGLAAAMLALGFVLGWIIRGGRIRREKSAINVGWQDQMSAQKNEHDRLADQNKGLMEQVSQYRASKKDADLRAKELSESLKEAFEKRDELQRQIKDVRNELEVASKQRDKLRKDLDSGAVRSEASEGALKEKDEKIFKLSRELENWQGRLPPLIERFRLRDKEAVELEEELGRSRERIEALEKMTGSDDTRIEPIDTNPIADGLDASNDQYDETSQHAVADLDAADTDDDDSDDERTGIDTYLEEGTVDFDLGNTDLEAAAVAEDASDDGFDDGADDQSDDAADDGADEESDDDEWDDDEWDDDEWDEVEEAAAPMTNGQDTAPGKDDLKQIKGVGPAIEKTLNDLGIYRFNQIAEMSEYDIDRVARELRGFRSRIYREDWIGQARMLQFEKTSTPA